MAVAEHSCSELAGFVLGKYENWKKNRKPSETKWQRNLDAFNSISRGQWKKGEGEDWRSDTFYNVTKAKCVSAYALICDILLQGAKVPFAISVSPWSQISYDELPEEERSAVDESTEEAQQHIDQQLMDCDADRAMMFNIMAGAIMGETYAKRTIRGITRQGFRRVDFAEPGMEAQGQYARYEPWEERISSPAWEYISNWDIFRDLESNDLKACAGIIHRVFYSAYELKMKRGTPFFIDEAIETAVSESAKEITNTAENPQGMAPGLRDLQHRERTIEVLEFWGRAPRRVVESFKKQYSSGGEMPNAPESYEWKDDDEKGDDVEIMAMVAGRQIVRFAETTPEDRPLYRAAWEDRLDEIGGFGVADNLEDVQKVLNGAVRGFEDNARLAGDVLIAFKSRFFAAKPEIKPGGTMEISEECEDARQAVQQITVQNVGTVYLDVLHTFERLADVVSMIPQISQGVRPEKSADTAYELSQMLENAGKYLGAVVRNFDQGLIEPIITDFYRYNMMDPEAPGKGDFIIKAQGFNSFQARIVRTQKLMQLLALVMQYPELKAEANLRPILSEIIKANDMDVDILLKTEADKQAEQEQAQAAMQQQLEMQTQLEDQAAAKEDQMKQADHGRKVELEAQKTASKLVGDMVNKAGKQPSPEAVQ